MKVRKKMKVLNNNIVSRYEAMGYTSVKQLSELNCLSLKALEDLINMKVKPCNNRGRIRPIVYCLCDIFGCIPSDLFDDHQMDRVVSQNLNYQYISSEMFTLSYNSLSIESMSIQHLLEPAMLEPLTFMTERERTILSERFGLDDGGGMTLLECGKIHNITSERIRQIEQKALRKLRHPSRLKYLLPFASFM